MFNKANHFPLPLFLFLTCAASQMSHPPDNVAKAYIPGNITIGALIPMHLPGKGGKCSVINSFLGMEVLEALLFAVDRINSDATLLLNVTLGVKAFDTCGSESAALDRAVKEFVLGDAWDSPTKECGSHTRPVIGVIGPGYSYEAVHVVTFLQLFEIPLISFSATSPELSDKSKFEFFSRTIPSDSLQTLAIVDLLNYFNWTYVSIAYTDESYGVNGFENLKNEAYENGICFATKQKVPLAYDKQEYELIVSELLSDPMAQVAVFICVESALHPLLKELQVQMRTKNRTLQLVGSETLGTVVFRNFDEIPDVAEHVFFFYLPTARVEHFDDYFLNLTVKKNTRNPWFKDYFAIAANCSFEDQPRRERCDPNQRLGDVNYGTFLGGFSHMPLVVDGVYAFAHALRRIQEDRCAGRNSSRDNTSVASKTCVPLDSIPGRELLATIRTQTFRSPSGSTVKFTETGDVIGKYDVYYASRGGDGVYKNTKVGEWKDRRLSFGTASYWNVRSRCSETCGGNEVQQRMFDKPSCCWECVLCAPQAFAVNTTTCRSCPEGHTPDQGRRECIRTGAKYFTLDGGTIPLYVAIIPILASIIGLTAVCLVAIVFAKHRGTPLVKASGRELSCLLLFGLSLSYLFPIAAILKPSPFKCLCQFVLDSFPFTVSYVAIAVKNNRIFRIFNPHRSLTVPPSFVRPKSQLILSLGLISFQAVLLLSLMLLDVPHEKLIYPSSTVTYLVCETSDTQVLFSHVYNIILLVVCTYYAYKTRDTPRNFNEAKYIAFAMYASMVALLTFIVVFFITSKRSNVIDKLAVRCFRVAFMATVLLVCFFAPKIYVILWKAEENVNHETVKKDSTATMSCEHEQTRGCENVNCRNHSKELNKIGILEVNKIGSTKSRSTQTDLTT